MYEFLDNYDNIYIDEWCLIPADIVYKLCETNLNIIFVGDIN
jgi:hypothetical protein